ncbi:LR74A-like protein [Mya arenaria]|uniref:LR74A-like protein n=1 Tax=Mya arenaria TaxID=6604 RepID=A0ABY7F9I0_MYAAR|nr:LR74A-like protein [Mya arenaria]
MSASHESWLPGLQSLLKGPVLITQPTPEEGVDDEVIDDVIDVSIDTIDTVDTDYETDLDMDYEEWIAEDMIGDEARQQQTYVNQCNETGVIPVSYFLRHITNTTFRMRHHGLGPLGAKAITISLKVSTWLEIICRSERNNLLDSGASSICEMLQKNTFLKHLYLANNKFEEQAAHNFREALSHNETLETLDLGWNHFRTNGAVSIAEGLQENYGLRSLLLTMNGFSEPGAEALGRALKHNRTLTELDVSQNRIKEIGAGHIALGLQTNDVLKKLKLGYNPISEDGALALLTAISKNDQSCVKHIDLSVSTSTTPHMCRGNALLETWTRPT